MLKDTKHKNDYNSDNVSRVERKKILSFPIQLFCVCVCVRGGGRGKRTSFCESSRHLIKLMKNFALIVFKSQNYNVKVRYILNRNAAK